MTNQGNGNNQGGGTILGHDLLARLTFKNKRLLDAMGPRTGRETALVAGCHEQAVYAYCSLRASPYKKNGELRASGKALCNYFELSAEELFPVSLYSGEIPAKIEGSYYSQELLPLLAARGKTYELDESAVDRERMAAVLRKQLQTLTPQEEMVLAMRFGLDGKGERTLEEIGDHFAICRERVRGIESKALRRMRKYARARALEPYIPVSCDS